MQVYNYENTNGLIKVESGISAQVENLSSSRNRGSQSVKYCPLHQYLGPRALAPKLRYYTLGRGRTEV